jgi:hypothetical protein
LQLVVCHGCPLLQYAVGAATKWHRSCYRRPPPMLPKVAGAPTICRRRCYQRAPTLLLKATGAAIVRPPSELLQSLAIGAASIRRRRRCERRPTLLLSAPSRLLRPLLQAAPTVSASGARRCY